MNQELIKFIELCLMDGVVTDKEREVIFRKSKKLGVPEDECEIILEGMIQQHKNNSTKTEPTQEVSPTPPPKEETSSSTEQNRLLTKDDIEGYDDMSIEEQNKQKKEIINKNNKILKNINKDSIVKTDDYKYEGQYDSNNLKTGLWKTFTNGKHSHDTYYINGKKHGKETFYLEGEISTMTKYTNDVKKYELVYDNYPKKLFEEYFDENGYIVRKIVFDTLNDSEISFEENYDNNVLKHKITFNYYNNKKEKSFEMFYDNNGNLNKEYIYGDNPGLKYFDVNGDIFKEIRIEEKFDYDHDDPDKWVWIEKIEILFKEKNKINESVSIIEGGIKNGEKQLKVIYKELFSP